MVGSCRECASCRKGQEQYCLKETTTLTYARVPCSDRRVQLTAQQPDVKLVRIALRALAAVRSGTRSLHANLYDKAIALPTERLPGFRRDR
jgi:methylmalonyl-CoA mutase N-terminal domain/subunit